MASLSGDTFETLGEAGQMFDSNLIYKDPLANPMTSNSDGKTLYTANYDQSSWNFTNVEEQCSALKEQNMPYLDVTRSVSSISSEVANSHGLGKGSPETNTDRTGLLQQTKKPRGKLLNEREMELMYAEDSLLNEEELAIKKKAQNRLAQRAFRQRKEMKLKELEMMLLQSEEERQQLMEKFNQVKVQFSSLQSENNRLRSLSRSSSNGNASVLEGGAFTFPESQEDFVDKMISNKAHDMSRAQVNKVYDLPQVPGRKVLGVGALWDYLLIKREEEQFENVDLLEVMQLLKGSEVCHGYGPAYPLDIVENALLCVANRPI